MSFAGHLRLGLSCEVAHEIQLGKRLFNFWHVLLM